MARPRKNNAEYFSHKREMRNDDKIKAVRKKYSHLGYSLWCMLLERLCEADNFKLKYDQDAIELMAGDFDVEEDKLKEIIEYFVHRKLVVIEDNMLFSQKLIDSFFGLIQKRNRQRLEEQEHIMNSDNSD